MRELFFAPFGPVVHGAIIMDELRQKRPGAADAIRDENRLARIEAALDRLDSGTYGFCDICAEPIAIRRLERDPAVLVCGACVAKH